MASPNVEVVSGGSKEALGPHRLVPLPLGLAPPLENPGSATVCPVKGDCNDKKYF